ncbi:MAG TPA: sigma-E factor negative regulatory protein, partial [Arenimonas sp.]|nr:sigma-E factor negative regulatory protein [Arenimonas sp.]
MNSMNALDDKICEQLSAWMDGELSREEAMFLERRLQHDEALQSLYSRMQISSACMKGQSVRLMPNTLCADIKLALAEQESSGKSRSPLFAWAAAASLAFAAFVFVPGLMQKTSEPQTNPATNNQAFTTANNTVASFASADLIADVPSAVSTTVVATTTDPVQPVRTVNSSPETVATNDIASPETFPLNVSSEKKAWPRSPVNANSDPALEAYLVRHNQMMAQDGMGGFVP